jgi:formate-dependent nitrite reductase cytochrome c552 subunit
MAFIPLIQAEGTIPLEIKYLSLHFTRQAFVHAATKTISLEAKMPVYRAFIVGLHDRAIGVVQMDCHDDNSAIQSAKRLVDNHDVELWQMDRPVARFDARSKQVVRK